MVLAASDFGESFVLELVALAILVALIWRYLLPPLNRAMARRMEQIRAQLEAGALARLEAEQLVAQKRSELEAGKAEAATILEQARHSVLLLHDDGERRAGEEYERVVSRSAVEIATAYARVRQEVLSELGVIVLAAAEEIVSAELDQPLQHRLIGEAILATESATRGPADGVAPGQSTPASPN